MGQSASSHSGHRTRRPSLKQITFSSMGKRKCNNSKNLSHTFSFPDETLKIEQLNVNIATEEELMTLPGISRNLASNIVSHRQMIGRFNRVEDLALVSGVGAHKLELFKLEVYVPSTSASGTSSRASISMDSVGNSENIVDVNGASIFALQGVPGVNQELASKIVERRLKHGPYRSLDELAKLGGMGKHRFAMIKPYLKINGISNGSVTPTPSNGSSLLPWNGPQASSTPKVNNTSRQTPQINRNKTSLAEIYRNDEDKRSVEFNAGISEDEIWELLSVASPRPSVYPEFSNETFYRSSIRIATWNLTGFNSDKAGNPGVMEVICRTILENRLALLALQEVKSPEALDKLTRELNTPSLKRVRDWRENQRSWRSIHLGAGLAVLWDSNPDKCITLKEQPPATTVLLPVLASCIFHVNKVDLTLINVHVHDMEDNRIIERFTDTKNAIFLGDFTLADDTSNSYNEALKESNTAVYSEKFIYKDKIIWGKGSKKLFNTDLARVVRLGLTHLGIPYGWRWGGPASNHCPIWCEIFTEPIEA
ncbi:endonuclease/exonuclease/phosphatase family domain-containing protein 1-like isoform X2 [Venturia canescens]|uniref:endonuclease/exonuclease/phosphatase family domain-containing protein 1-like isoform X2 n=1 Tax=Venturia canescens TaxID=32260 RepID=UPI001C9D3BB0|nr:endonuclease/exonuclease/phosphatase family domain-containing protein 1-like isoform X2 [Venturia canescens]